tara:strand:+ start:2933 stop:4045 length:1113 start_codon:yes stop_codon:yes gene_type:complete
LKKINFVDLRKQYELIKEEIDSAIAESLEKTDFILGEKVSEFEDILSKYTSTEALTVANGTDALFISLKSLGIKEGDEVIIPSFTWVSTAEAVKLLGGIPIYVDIREDTFNINEQEVKKKLTDNSKVIMPVSIFGRCCNLTELSNIAKENNLKLIEDAAQSYGAKHQGMMSCSIADISTTSFFPAKPLGCYGDGGAIFAKDQDKMEEIRMISRHGQKERYNYKRVGVNSRLDTLQARILIEKHKIFEKEISRRNIIAERYNRNLKDYLQIKCPEIPNEENRSVWAQYTIILDQKLADKRTEIMKRLQERGIPTALYYPAPIHKQKPYLSSDILPVTEDLATRVLSLPMHPYLGSEEVDYISDELIQLIKI